MNFLIIQTAFIGDVVLATSLIENIQETYPEAKIDFLLRKGNQSLLQDHPFIRKVFIWDKDKKIKSQFEIIRSLRKVKYDYTLNLQRYLSSGIFTIFSGARTKIGFKKNPLSFFFSEKVVHSFTKGVHEVDRNHELIKKLVSQPKRKLKLYPTSDDYNKVAPFKLHKYYLIAPSSVWYTKQWPQNKWIELINALPNEMAIYLVGGPNDYLYCKGIVEGAQKNNVENLAGKFSLLQTAALMKDAQMNYVNDSAPLHLCSAMNARVRAIFCSTSTEFGYTPLSDDSEVIEVKDLACRPCGLHGHKACPKGHFRCAQDIEINKLLPIN